MLASNWSSESRVGGNDATRRPLWRCADQVKPLLVRRFDPPILSLENHVPFVNLLPRPHQRLPQPVRSRPQLRLRRARIIHGNPDSPDRISWAGFDDDPISRVEQLLLQFLILAEFGDVHTGDNVARYLLPFFINEAAYLPAQSL